VPTKDFHGTVVQRLWGTGATRAQIAMALAVLQQIRWYSIGPDLDVCTKTAGEIAEELGLSRKEIPAAMTLLEQAGAIRRIVDGREKVICLSQEYAAAEVERGRFREITLPLFVPLGKYGFKVGMTNAKGFWRQFRTELSKMVGPRK